MSLPWIPDSAPPDAFPRAELALDEPNGLLAAGGDLSVARLLAAYQQGIFPWYDDEQPILWWSPDPRCLFPIGQVKAHRRLKRWVRQQLNTDQPKLTLSFDTAFTKVMDQCAAERYIDGKRLPDQHGTWITDDMHKAYAACYSAGHAHSVEVWQGTDLVGGLYGLAIGQAFFAESMFSRVSNASKLALFALDRHLTQWHYQFIDAQLPSAHLQSLGAEVIPRERYLQQLQHACSQPTQHQWHIDTSLVLAST